LRYYKRWTSATVAGFGTCNVRIARRNGRGERHNLEEKVKIYVGNLSYSTTEDSLRSAFAEFGAVEEVAVITDRDTGRPRGFGFVTMTNDEEAKAAIEALNEKELDGRALRVNEARPRRDADAPRRSRW